MQERKKNKSAAKNISIGFTGLEFSRRILNKYAFFRKSGKLPSLIFLKLFNNKIESGKIRPYPQSKSIINYFRFHFSFYFGIVMKSMGVSGSSPMEHVSFIIEFIEPHLQSGENELKRISNSVKKIDSKKYYTGWEQKIIFEFLNIQGKRAATRYNFISMPQIFQPYDSKSDSFRISGESGSSTSIRSQYVQTINIAGKQLNSNIFPEFIYLDMFHQMMLHMHHKPGKNYSNLLLIKKKAKEINYSYAPPSERRDSSYHFSYLMPGPAKIALSPAASGYLQRNRYPENAGSIRYNAASPVVFRKMNKELGLLPGHAKVYSAMDSSNAGKMDILPMNQNRTVQDIRYEHTLGSDRPDSSYYFSYLMTGPAKIALSPAASGYLQRNRNLENAGSMRYNAASPVVFQKINRELSISGSLPGHSKVYSAKDSSDAGKTDNLSMNKGRIAREIQYEHAPDRHDSSYYFSYLMTGLAKIALSPAASGYLQRNRNLENAGSIRYNISSPEVFQKIKKELGSSLEPEKIYSAIDSPYAGKTDNLSINQDRIARNVQYEHAPDRHNNSYYFSYLIAGPAKIALSPAATGYLQRNRNPENAGSIRYNAASPVVFQKINRELSISRSLPGPAKVYSAMDSSDAGITNNLSMNQNRTIQDIRYKYAPDQHDSSYHFLYLITGPAKIALSPAATGYLRRSRHIENAGLIHYNAASPAVFRKMNAEFGSSGSASYQSQNLSIVRKNGQNKNLNFRESTGNNTYNPSELVIKKTSLQGTENLTRNAEEKIMSARSTDHSIKDSIRPINEINRIADRVYHIIERKISIEKDRRGLL